MIPEASARDLAGRMDNAIRSFRAYLADQHGLKREQADNVIRLYRSGGRRAILRIDPVMGQWTVSHGALLRHDVILRAAQCA